MKVDLDDGRVSVSWKHELKETRLGPGKTVLRWFSTCTIKPSTNDKSETVEPLATGTAGCHSHDLFDKNEGRIISLTRALNDIFPCSTPTVYLPQNKVIRRRFWDAYRKMRGGVMSGKALTQHQIEKIIHTYEKLREQMNLNLVK